MCMSPLRIKNPKLKAGTFLNGCDKEYLEVPCGHCMECQSKKVNDLVFRAFHEYLYTESCGGTTLFQTSTYSMDNCPYSGGFRFFRKSDLQKFIKRLRKRLYDDGYDVNGNLSYLVTCEYGDDPKGMHLPHYHWLLFNRVPGLNAFNLDRYFTLCWKSLGTRYTKSDKLGFLDNKDVARRVVNSIYAIQYVCKYIVKGTSVKDALLANPYSVVTEYMDDWVKRNKLNWNDVQDYQLVKAYSGFKLSYPQLDEFQLMPFYLQSKGLGLSFLSDVGTNELLDIVKLPTKSFTGFANFTIPHYYIRKVFYTYHPEDKRFTLNQLGREYRDEQLKSLTDSYYDLLDHNDALLNSISQKFYKTDFQSLINKYLAGRDVSHFVDYCIYLKDRQINPKFDWLVSDFVLMGDIHDFCLDVENDNFLALVSDSSSYQYYVQTDLFGTVVTTGKSDRLQGLIFYNQLDYFSGYDDLYKCLQKIKADFSKANCLELSRKLNDMRYKSLAKSVFSPQNAVFY